MVISRQTIVISNILRLIEKNVKDHFVILWMIEFKNDFINSKQMTNLHLKTKLYDTDILSSFSHFPPPNSLSKDERETNFSLKISQMLLLNICSINSVQCIFWTFFFFFRGENRNYDHFCYLYNNRSIFLDNLWSY